MTMNIKPWCTCMATGKWLRQDGYTLDPPSGLWVHGRCRKPSKMNYDRLILGKDPIPQPRKEEDIYDIEMKHEARMVVALELSWIDDEDEDELYESWSIDY